MALIIGHLPHHEEIFKLPGFLRDPVLTLGFQDILPNARIDGFDYPDLGALLRARGLRSITTLDLFDERADLRIDLNEPLPKEHVERYRTLIDIGSLEHVFDFPRALLNCMQAVTVSGHLMLHAPVNGCLWHGLYTFSPELLIEAFRLNGFEIVYLSYSSGVGRPLRRPSEAKNVIMWIVGRKTWSIRKLVAPHQQRWVEEYKSDESKPKPFDDYYGLLRATEERYRPFNFCCDWQSQKRKRKKCIRKVKLAGK